jgi:GTP diphosphokinase / guanosine-3',5'-bis(diphosphate) 3'-diphosphatase
MATADLPIDSFPELLGECAEYLDMRALETVRKAYAVAAQAHKGTLRDSGEPYIEHPLAVAHWLAERRVTVDCIAAALLHDVVEDTPVSLNRLRMQFGDVVARLVDGVTKFDAVEDPDEGDELSRRRERKRRQQAETLRKLLLAMAEDPRTALIKIADRLHNLRTLGAVSHERQMNKARETMEIYVPLASRLGMGEAKYDMEDLVLRYLDPRRYEWLRQQMAQEQTSRAERTQITVHALQRVLMHHEVAAEVQPHIKHISSVHRRMRETGNERIGDIGDFITYSVLVQTKQECYKALRAVHSQWHQIDRRVRDYIGGPKLNGYQALHTTLFGMDGYEDPFDVHIRSYAMQEIADLGPVLIAARRSFAVLPADRSQAWIDLVRSWQQELSLSAMDLFDAVRGDLFQDQIFIFTPKGEIKDIAHGATVLDFAYRVHTDIGNHCIGGRVTGSDNITHVVGRDFVLRDRDTVHILTDERVHPEASWVHHARTHHARDAVVYYLREHDLPVDDDAQVIGAQPTLDGITSVRLGICCEPAPEDALIAIITGRRMMVHRAECHHVAEKIAERAAGGACEDQRVIPIRWGQFHVERYRVSLLLSGRDRAGLMHDVSDVLANHDLNIIRLGALSITSRYKAVIQLTVEVRRPEQLQRAVRQLEYVAGVAKVERRQRVTPAAPHE